VRLAYEFVGPRLAPVGWELRLVAYDLRPSPIVQIRPPIDNWLDQARPTANIPQAEIIRAGTGDWETDSYELLVDFVGTTFGRPATVLYGVDQQTNRVDLRGIDRFRG
jgi:hypothetical protein